MARDPNDIAMTSEDVDLSVYQSAMGDGGATDLADYAATVATWGPDATDAITAGPKAQGAACSPTPRALYHPTHRMATPFVIASVVAILILIVVFFPE